MKNQTVPPNRPLTKAPSRALLSVLALISIAGFLLTYVHNGSLRDEIAYGVSYLGFLLWRLSDK